MATGSNARHTLSFANRIFRGGTYYGKYEGGKRGLEIPDLFWVDLGAVAASDADGVSASQSVGAGANFLINGALATGGVATFDVPRNVVAAWTTTSILTITGTDEYGETMVEVSASGTSHTGTKAFKTVTSVSSSASITSATVGTAKVIGLPFRIDAKNQVLVVSEDGKAETTSTVVVAVTTDPATGTTGDVRGTVALAGTPDATKTYSILMARGSTPTKVGQFGVAQFAG
jgi:hypothetical protein